MIIIPKRRWAFPVSQERTYVKTLRSYVSHITAAMNSALSDMKQIAERNGLKMDSYGSDLDALLKKLEADIDKRVAEKALRRRIEQIYGNVNTFNDAEFKAVIKAAVGAEDFFINEKWQKTAQAVWVQENLNLIRSIKSQTLEKIRYQMGDMILNAQGKQLRTAELSEMIQSVAQNNKNRAELIARDQIGKLNGRLTQLRQTSAGISRYTWSTSNDERVRPAHAAREGKIFEWAHPPSDGNPGYPIRCRCVGIPVIDTSELGINTEESVKIKEEDTSLPSKIAGAKRGDPMDETEADEGRPNPNFDKGIAYKINCQSCVVTYEARLRGYNVETLPNYEEAGSALYKLSKDTRLAWIDPLTGKKPDFIPHPASAKTVKSYLRWLNVAVEKGKRYTLQVYWKRSGGHIVHIRRNSDDRLEIYDPQTGELFSYKLWRNTRTKKSYKTSEDMVEWFLKQVRFTYYGRWAGPELLRVDDKAFNLDIVNAIMQKYGGDES